MSDPILNKTAANRKQLLINKDFQYKLILKATVPLIVILITISTLVLWQLSQLETSFTYNSTNELIATLSAKLGSSFQSSTSLFASIRFWAFIVIGCLSLVGIAFLSYIFLLISHRIAGPLWRFEKGLDDIRNGRLNKPIILREKDEFKETAESFNETLLLLSEQLKTIQKSNDDSISAITSSLSEVEKTKRLKKNQDEIKQCLKKFQL